MKAPCAALALGAALSGVAWAEQPTGSSGAPATNAVSGDPYLWLEDIHGTRALDWVHAQNAVTKKAFMDSPGLAKTRGAILGRD